MSYKRRGNIAEQVRLKLMHGVVKVSTKPKKTPQFPAIYTIFDMHRQHGGTQLAKLLSLKKRRCGHRTARHNTDSTMRKLQ